MSPRNDWKVAHLLRRAGFGATPEQLRKAQRQGLQATLEELLAYAQRPDPLPGPPPYPVIGPGIVATLADGRDRLFHGPAGIGLQRRLGA